jgi:hypothetical protein
MNRASIPCLALAFGFAAASSARAAPVTRDDFLVNSAANLVSLCTASQSDPMFTPAMNFCHGFVTGTYRVIEAEEAATKRKQKMFCLPENKPTRDQAIAAFVPWASARPKTLGGTPTDAIAEYLSSQYPCK